MNTITISRSNVKGKKYKAVYSNNGTINFGAKGYSDYTIHKNDDRKANYLQRHIHDPHDPHTAGELSRTILWSKKNIHAAAREF
jgi:Family of unknown function (DUF5754)